MPRKRESKKPARGTQQGRPLTEHHKNAILQTYATVHNKEEVGRICGVSANSVRRVLAEQNTAELQQARAEAAVSLAKQVHSKAVDVINKIDDSKLDTSSGAQLAVIGGILIDKLPVLERFRQEITAGTKTEGGMPLPADVHQMIAALGNKIKSIDVLRVELRDDHMEQELRTARELLEKASIAATEDIVEAEFEEIDLDNPGEATS